MIITHLHEVTHTELGSGAIAHSKSGCARNKVSSPRLGRQPDLADESDDDIYGGDVDAALTITT